MRQFRVVLSLVVFALTASPAAATEIAGKWGIGFDTGTLLESSAEGSILRGHSARTAWLLDVFVSQNVGHGTDSAAYPSPDTTISRDSNGDGLSVNAGPRLRRFTHPDADVSPYWDLYVHGIHSYSRGASGPNSTYTRQSGADLGLGFGVEYFLKRWPVSIAAASPLLRIGYRWAVSRASYSDGIDRRTTSSQWSTAISISPHLQFRAYF